MMRIDEMRHDEWLSLSDQVTKRSRCRPLPWRARSTVLLAMLLGLIASNLLLTPVLAEAATQKAKSVRVITPVASSSDKARVSPYTIANRQHAATRTARSPTTALSVRPPHNMTGQQH